MVQPTCRIKVERRRGKFSKHVRAVLGFDNLMSKQAEFESILIITVWENIGTVQDPDTSWRERCAEIEAALTEAFS